jgi:hypothetical protein
MPCLSKLNFRNGLVYGVLTLAASMVLQDYRARHTGAYPLPAQQVYPGASWATASPQEVGMDPVRFAEALQALPEPAIVIRYGKVIGTKGDVARSGLIWSGSKSLLALLVGRLIQQGQLSLEMIVPGSDQPSPPPANYRHFLSMTSDWHLAPHQPGAHYAYNNGAVIHYGEHLKDTYFPGRDPVQMLKEAYLDVLGYEDHIGFQPEISGWGVGWSLSTRDLARVGYLVLRYGNWNGQQLIDRAYVESLYQNQIPIGATQALGGGAYFNEEPYTSALPGAYSFGFWLPQRTTLFNGSRSQTPAAAISGAFGTTVFISPATDLVIAAVNTSPHHNEGGRISATTLDQFAAAILPASDTTPPTVTVVSPEEGATLSGMVIKSSTATDDQRVERVQFLLNGQPLGPELTTTPYQLSWDTRTVGNGAYQLGARATDAAGNVGVANAINITIQNAPAPTPTPTPSSASVTSLTLINADTDAPISGYESLPDGVTINLASLPTRNLNIRANTNPAQVARVQFDYDQVVNFRTEGVAPYALAGDTQGDYWPWTPTTGQHRVTAIPVGTDGQVGTPLTIHFTVTADSSPTPTPAPTPTPTPTPPSAAALSLTLINADTDAPISGYESLPDGVTINLASLPTRNLNLRANTSPATVARVQFNYDDVFNFRTEGVVPYALAGDTNGDYWNWTPTVGQHQVTAIPVGSDGRVGTSLTIRFTVTQ